MRTEQEIFDSLEHLCRSPGYAHALSCICLQENAIALGSELSEADLARFFSHDRLLRTEQSTLVGLLMKQDPVDFLLPSGETMSSYIKQTYELLEELHDTFRNTMADALGQTPRSTGQTDDDPFSRGDVLREPIFYGGDSAYSFQYRDLSIPKYRQDNDWLVKNRGFTIDDARTTVMSIQQILSQKGNAVFRDLLNLPPDQWTLLPSFVLSVEEVSSRSRLSRDIVRRVFNAFSIDGGDQNGQFCTLKDFNIANAKPLIPLDDTRFVLFSFNSLTEAIYVGPYYWMWADRRYRDTAAKNRGRFAERFTIDRFTAVFGEANVYPNVTIGGVRGRPAGEIDVLVVYCDRAIVVQVKSKQFTLEARAGNNNSIHSDFKKSVQDSYDQALSCARLLLRPSQLEFVDDGGRVVQLPHALSEIYTISIVSDHYPALNAQVRTFLKYGIDDAIRPPIVLDLFALDVMTEFLQSPMWLLSYLDRRVTYEKRVFAHHELSILAYHMEHNLWLEPGIDFVYIHDDFTMPIDVAMMVRREGMPGVATPDGILTRILNTAVGRIVSAIEQNPEPITLDLGLLLLRLNEDSINDLSKNIDKLDRLTRADGRNHNASLLFDDLGITLHCGRDSYGVAIRRLYEHCNARKYLARAKTWYGLSIGANLTIRLSVRLNQEWTYDAQMEAHSRSILQPGTSMRGDTSGLGVASNRVGRNERCPCGSGKKYKHCCYTRLG